MGTPELSAETSLRPDEVLLGQWDLHLDLIGGNVASTDTRFLLTDSRLIVLSRPNGRLGVRLTGHLVRTREAVQFMSDLGKWHVIFNGEIRSLPEPRMTRVDIDTATTLPSNRAIEIGTKRLWVGEDRAADSMFTALHERWAAAQSLRPTAEGHLPM
jgi:hypothetical protein